MIVLSVSLLLVIAVVSYMYGKKQLRRGKITMKELEQTELLLSDVTEAHERMKQAWVIEGSVSISMFGQQTTSRAKHPFLCYIF